MLTTNKTPCGTYRGPGRYETDFIRERMIDLAAQDLKIDRVELRRHNLVADAQMPYPLASITPYDSSHSTAATIMLSLIDVSRSSAGMKKARFEVN
jgi:CO/xanthine dehydrogenase Mo-binding subunit